MKGHYLSLTAKAAEDPLIKLLVQNTEITFLMDTGATKSTIQESDLLGVPKSCQTTTVVGSSSLPHLLQETLPLSVAMEKGHWITSS